jgi:hypothetical protein
MQLRLHKKPLAALPLFLPRHALPHDKLSSSLTPFLTEFEQEPDICPELLTSMATNNARSCFSKPSYESPQNDETLVLTEEPRLKATSHL